MSAAVTDYGTQQNSGRPALQRDERIFPNNHVEYFVSYYDYYQPEAYVPKTDTYIEKDSALNEQIDRMRNAATRNILETTTSLSWPLSPAFTVWATLNLMQP